jgi:hypothetical protein
MRSHTRNRTLLLALAGAILMSACADNSTAEPQGQALEVEQVAGLWTLKAPDGATCDVSLANLLIGDIRPVLVERCAISAVEGAKMWRAIPDGFQLMGQEGQVLMRFRRTGEDSFEALGGGHTLTRAPLS